MHLLLPVHRGALLRFIGVVPVPLALEVLIGTLLLQGVLLVGVGLRGFLSGEVVQVVACLIAAIGKAHAVLSLRVVACRGFVGVLAEQGFLPVAFVEVGAEIYTPISNCNTRHR